MDTPEKKKLDPSLDLIPASLLPLKALSDELIQHTHESAQQSHVYDNGKKQQEVGPLITSNTQWIFDTSSKNYLKDYDINASGGENVAKLMKYARELATHTQDGNQEDSNLRATKLLAADRITLNALGNMYRAMATPSPEERFKAYFKEGFSGAKEDPNHFIEALEGAQKNMIISIVQTMHPTIYHTKFARERETALTRKLEEITDVLKAKPEGERDTKDPKAQELLRDAKGEIDKLVAGLAAGEKITPNKRVTVAEENTLDRENHRAMQASFNDVVKAYNNALKEVVEQAPLTKEQADKARGLAIDSSRIEYRTWAFGADADGRAKATSIVLFDGIHRDHNLSGKKFNGRKRDTRENAKEHENSVSCLIQRAYINSPEFRKYCEEFIEEQNRKHRDEHRNGFVNPHESILQQLGGEEKADFIQHLILADHKIPDFQLVPAQLEKETIAFNQMFAKEYKAFLTQEGLPPETELESLKSIKRKPGDPQSEPNDKLLKLVNFINDKKLKVDGREEEIYFDIDTNALTYESRPYVMHSRLFEDLKVAEVINGKMTTRTIKPEERRKTLDVVKRLQVLDDAINEYGNQVSDRYQIANFGSKADFYAALLLFKETGIMKVENGKVVSEKKEDGKILSPKLSIQPLLETEEDQRNAVELFRELLKDPLVRSYYAALGNKADMMVGYSDGAKSAGNFASEWSIRNCARDLQKVFEESKDEKGNGIKLRVFHGRGRGDSRGGQFEEGQDQRMIAPELQKDMVFDVTMQSDKPMHDAISKSLGRDTLAGIITGTITAKREAEALDRDPKRKEWLESLEPSIQSLADTSQKEYIRLVTSTEEGNDKNTMKLIKTVHDNPWKSSRDPGRKSGEPKLEDQRAITVEYGLNMADAPLHYIGLQKALKEFIDNDKSVMDEKGQVFKGGKALEMLYDSQPFMHGMLDKTERGLIDYDPVVFRKYAAISGIDSRWTDQCVDELSGMRELVQKIRTHGFSKGAARESMKEAIRQGEGQDKEEALSAVDRTGIILHDPSRGINGILSQKEGQAKRRYDAIAYDVLQNAATDLDKRAHALAISTTINKKTDDVESIDAVKNRLGYNPFNPSLEKEHNATEGKVEFKNNLAFVISESNRNKLLRPPASIVASVDNVPYRAA